MGSSRSLFWALILGGSLIAILIELRSGSPDAADFITPSPILPILDEVAGVTKMVLVVGSERVSLSRDPASHWQRGDCGAGDATFSLRVDEGLNFLGRARALRVVDRTSATSERYGLEAPEIAITFFSMSGSSPDVSLRIGAGAPDHLSVYVAVNPGLGIVTVSHYHVRNLRDLVREILASEPC